MKIGILTFHWATNYGAVLQTLSLQNYLQSIGHIVKVINYKPRNRDFTLWNFIRNRDFLNLSSYVVDYKRERALSSFREGHLNLTARYYKTKDVANALDDFDIIISGSDQVMCASFLSFGEGRGKLTPIYYLGFPFEGKKVAYAVSFGTTVYPSNLISLTSSFLKSFDKIGVRERTGIDVVRSMGREDAVVVPDPTLLSSAVFYDSLSDGSYDNKKDYTFCFFIRNIQERKKTFVNITQNLQIWNNGDNCYTMGNWISKIKNASFVFTDSYHCMIMCLKFHVNFIVVTEKEGVVGMNDRLYTLLDYIGLKERIVPKSIIDTTKSFLQSCIDWTEIDKKLYDYSQKGVSFLDRL